MMERNNYNRMQSDQNGCYVRWIQPVNATHALNLSAGVSNANILRGRSLSCRAMALSLA